MALFKPYKIQSSQLNSLPKKEGQFIITTDTKKIYLDINNTTRAVLNPDSNYETWTFTLNNGSTITKDVCVD